MALKILLADDSMTAQNMGKKILADAGYEVIPVSNGAQAVKKIAEHKPDLAILDVYMPGYSGLEVCERVKKAAETAAMPVILTYGKMEPFKPEEGTRVGCDGLIVKPFEASELLATVKKIEEKMAAAAAAPAAEQYEETIKISMPVVEEFKDASYEEWKVTAEDHMDERTGEGPAAAAMEVPQDMLASPAFGMEEIGEAPPAMPAVSPDLAETAALEAPVRAGVALEPEIRRTTEQIEPALQAAAGAAAAAAPEEPPPAPPMMEEFTAPPVAAPEIEFTSAPQAEVAPPAIAPGFEPTVMQEEVAVRDTGRDPALVTDSQELAKFTTKFGVEGAEPIHVGVAADMPELYADAQQPVEPAKVEADLDFEARVAAAMSGYEEFGGPAAAPAEPVAEVPPPAEAAPPEVPPAMVEEMQRAVESMPVAEPEPAAAAPELEPIPIAVPTPAAAPENVPDHELADAMAAAVGASVEPQIVAAVADATQALRPDLIAEIVHRVVDRMKPELVTEITKELEQRLKK